MVIRRRRLLALAVLVSVMLAFLRAVFQNDSDDPDGLLALSYVIAALMVLGTLGFGLSLWLLRCPRCGHHFGADVAGGIEIFGHSVVDAMVALIRRFHCRECGFDEREALDDER